MTNDETLHTATWKQAAQLGYCQDKFQTLLISQKADVKTILFAFSKGQELKTHTAAVEVVVVPVEGQAVFTLESQEQIIRPGDIIKIPAYAPHAVKAVTNFKMLLIK